MCQLICYNCKTAYSANKPKWRCNCGSILELEFKPHFHLDKIKGRKPSMWRYREAIPIKNDLNIISFEEGFTPLIKINIGSHPVLIKQEQLLPTGSFKDRGAAVLISKVKELGIKHVVEDSSGNAGAAIAAYCAKANINCTVFVPESASAVKMAQIEGYGSKLKRIPGSREDTSKAVSAAAENIYYASHVFNPYFLHGTKTIAYEICEQLQWKSPDTIIVPVGNGSLILGMAIGFNDLMAAKVIQKKPKLIGIQSENCAPLFHTFKKNQNQILKITKKKTIAEGIAISNPPRGMQIIEAVKKTDGEFITVSEKEISESLSEIRRKGYYIEPTSASVVAGIKKYMNHIKKSGEMVVSVFTGHGLKTTRKTHKIY